jgi:hypothetical protein
MMTMFVTSRALFIKVYLIKLKSLIDLCPKCVNLPLFIKHLNTVLNSLGLGDVNEKVFSIETLSL